MIKVQDIALFRGNYSEDQIIKARKMTSNDKVAQVEVRIIRKYPLHCLVEEVVNPKYRWCVNWIDLMLYGGIS